MPDIVLMKVPGGALVPADEAGVDFLAKLKLGAGVKVKATRYNNVGFHRKLFALLDLAYDAWEPEPVLHKGHPVSKNKEQFREDLTILAGFYESAVRLDGTVRFTAKSWSFSSMPDEEKEKLYNAIINVVLAKVLTQYTRDDLDRVIDQLMQFTT